LASVWLAVVVSANLSSKIMTKACSATVYIPMTQPGVRSLNLSVSVAVGLFEARRQLGYLA
jgi:tRNA (cytidine/uridine-2'-O-)-methyltransferase